MKSSVCVVFVVGLILSTVKPTATANGRWYFNYYVFVLLILSA